MDWTSPENPSLWRDALKTLFDPCPAGWRVPQSGDKASGKCPWGAFTLADATANTPWDVAAAGYHWHPETVHNSPVWYPAGGSRYDNSKLYVIGHSGYAWSASSGRHYLGMDPGTITPDRNSASDSYGFPVRCIRE